MSDSNHIFFRQYKASKHDFMFHGDQKRSSDLDLENSMFILLEMIPKNFTITTNDKTYYFNKEILRDASTTINNCMISNPDLSTYHLNIKDKRNTMQKIEQLFLGKEIFFKEEEIHTVRKITSNLGIERCPNIMKTESLASKYDNYSYCAKPSHQNLFSIPISLNKICVFNFFKGNLNSNFTIVTKSKEYKCDSRSVFLSNVIREKILKNPELNEYFYDFENEFEEFNDIYELFMFKQIQITSNNIKSLKKIAEDLQISCILDQINEFNDKYEENIQKINEEQNLIDSIEQLFEWLFQIDKFTPEFVKNSIVDSFWSKTEENVQELVSFLLQVIYTNFNYHSQIFELIVLLHQAANETNYLHILMPFLINRLMLYFSRCNLNSAFVYRLYKSGFISKEMLFNEFHFSINELINRIGYKHQKGFYRNQYTVFVNNDHDDNIVCSNMLLWFLPELLEKNKLPILNIQQISDKNILEFINTYYPDHMDEFDRMRESGEPPDELARSLIHDDIDEFQAIVTQSGKKITKDLVPFNIFDNYVDNGNTNYLNYAAAYGSVKCFKYLLMNHARIEKLTFKYAIFGENSEIIRIVYQKEDQIFESKMNKPHRLYVYDDVVPHLMLYPAIIKHNNKIFDWLFEKINSYKNPSFNSSHLVYSSFMNGSAHSLMACIDNGVDINSFMLDNLLSLLKESIERGFCRFTQLAFHFIHDLYSKPKANAYLNTINICHSAVISGNVAIFKMVLNIMKNEFQSKLLSAMYDAISANNMNIIKYMCETQNHDPSRKEALIKQNSHYIDDLLIDSLRCNRFEIFKYLMTKFNIKKTDEVFSSACDTNNYEIIKEMTDFIISKNQNFDFTEFFIKTAKNKSNKVCRYFIDKKVYLDFNYIIKNASMFIPHNEDIFFLLNDNIDQSNKELFNTLCFDIAFQENEYSIAEYLLKNGIFVNDNALIEATEKHNKDMVDLILKYKNNPSFINQVSPKGTALQIAICNNDNHIVKSLLSVPGIDPSLYASNEETPLISAAINLNIGGVDLILDFYGERIQEQLWQVNKSLQMILARISYDKKDCKQSPNSRFSNLPFCSHPRILNVLNHLLRVKNVDVNIRFDKYTLLSYACELNQINLVQSLLKHDKINVNSYVPADGNTPLLIALKNKCIEISEILINLPQININHKNYNHETPLLIAASENLETIIPLILNHKKFDPIESNLNYAFYLSKGNVAKLLSSVKELDVNNCVKTVLSDQKYVISILCPLKEAILNRDDEKFELIISHPSFNIHKSNVKDVMISAAVLSGREEFFKKLFELFDKDLNFLSDGEILLHAVKNCSQKTIAQILQCKTFDSKKSDIISAFVASITCSDVNKDTFAIMQMLYHFDRNHDRLIDFASLVPLHKSLVNSMTMKKSFFTIIPKQKQSLSNFVSFFLKNGADPNHPDEFGVFPLQRAIYIKSIDFIHCLIDSGKIDFSVRINNNGYTYLHYAALMDDSLVLNEILTVKNIDVNATDFDGNTPLLLAAKNQNERNFRMLFEVDGIDFKHKNNNGQDCLQMLIGDRYRNNINYDELETKNDYFIMLNRILLKSERFTDDNSD